MSILYPALAGAAVIGSLVLFSQIFSHWFVSADSELNVHETVVSLAICLWFCIYLSGAVLVLQSTKTFTLTTFAANLVEIAVLFAGLAATGAFESGIREIEGNLVYAFTAIAIFVLPASVSRLTRKSPIRKIAWFICGAGAAGALAVKYELPSWAIYVDLLVLLVLIGLYVRSARIDWVTWKKTQF